MIDIEKLAKDIFGTVIVNGNEYYELDAEGLKQFAESYHKTMCEQSEPIAFIDVTNRKLKWAVPTSFDTLSTVAVYDDIPLYTTPQPLKRLSESRINELAYESINDVAGVLAGYTTQEQYFAGLIMDEMERINK